jgi:serine/threonine protein kinase
MPEIRRFIIQTCGAVKYLHYRNIIHRDLKTGNLFLDKGMNIKVGDFGLAAMLVGKNDIGARRTTMCGTPNYLAPEILEKGGRGHNEKVDLWAIGIIAYDCSRYPRFSPVKLTSPQIHPRCRQSTLSRPKTRRHLQEAAKPRVRLA